MTLAELLPGLAFVLAAVGLWLEGLHRVADAPRARAWARRAQAGSAAVLAGTLAWLALAFLRGDLGYRYVWGHTHLALPWMYRLAGTWAGQEGTTLLWATLLAGFLWVLLRDRELPDDLASATHLVAGSIVALLALFLVLESPFAATPAPLLHDPATSQGAGLNDLLVTPLMVVHPPIQFVAYALAAIPGSLALAHWATGTRGWLAPARRWARWGFLAATAGLALGALWAYYVLSFGGYWAWDPVETVNLLPWLGLLAFMHVARRGDDVPPLATPLLASLGLLLPFFSTVTVRSGLWVSVHAFTDPTSTFVQDPGLRLLRILEVHPPTSFFLGLLLFLGFLTVALALRHHGPRLATTARGHRLVQGVVLIHAVLAAAGLVAPRVLLGGLLEAGRVLAGGHATLGLGVLAGVLAGAPLLGVYAARQPHVVQDDARRLLSWRRFPKLAALLLTLSLSVVLLLLLRTVNGGGAALLEQRAPLLALPVLTLLTVALAWHPLGRHGALALAGVGVAAGLLALLAWPASWVLALGLPVAGVALLAAGLRVRHEASSPRATRRQRLAGDGALLLGLAGAIVWTSPPSMVPAALAAVLWPGSLLLVLAGVALHRGRGPRDLPRMRRSLHSVAVHLVHLAVVLGMVGYGVSTYAATTTTLQEVPVPGTVSLGERVLELHPARGEERGDGTLSAVEVPVTVRGGDGGQEATGVLRLYWRGPPTEHYDPHLDVHRGLARDLVLNPLSLRTGEGVVEAHGDHARLTKANVTHATFQVQVRPGMNLLWGGAGLGAAGLLLTAWSAPRREGRV